MLTEIILIIIGSLLLILGFIGCVVPAIPGPVLSYLALIIISIPTRFTLYHPGLLIGLGTAAVLSQILDNIFPALASKKAGAGKAGIWGSIVGMIAGTILFPPFGVFIGAFTGAYVAELIFNRENDNPFKAAMGVFSGTLMGIFFKLSVSGVITFFFIRGTGKQFL
jgi:uncharacterized protein YqgC (DUF456 family)